MPISGTVVRATPPLLVCGGPVLIERCSILLAPLCRIQSAATVASAREHLARGVIPGVITARRLEDGDGLEIVVAARRRNPSVTALVIVGRDDRSVLRRAALLNALVHDEPVDAAVLDTFVATTLSAHGDSFEARLTRALDQLTRDRRFTPSEAEVLRLSCLGLRPEELCEVLSFEMCTFRKHAENVRAKTGGRFDDVVRHVLLQAAGGTPIRRAHTPR